MRVLHFTRMIVLTTVALFGASFMSATLAAPPAIDPCTLLTTAEVEQVVGKLKRAATGESIGNAVTCNYQFANDKDEFEIWASGDYAFATMRKDAKKAVSVKGLGDDAFMDRGAHGLDYVDLYIKKGTTLVKLSLRESAGDEEKLKALGRKAVGRF